ncbi:MAG TPA: inner membrane CreD family protein, partial [Candidatus Binatus sp.]|nr:inner membrane CreD family protein [Candidatus Binatus sp.]
ERRKGLLWYNTYAVAFAGTYRTLNPSDAAVLTLHFPLPGDGAIYDDVRVLVDRHPVVTTVTDGQVTAELPVGPHHSTELGVSYRSRGVGTWSYSFGAGVNGVHDFALTMTTDFNAIDFPGGTLAPTTESKTPSGWRLGWDYRDLVAGRGIGMVLPQRLQPGPLAQRITFWAPLSLLFYFFVMFIIVTIRRVDLHPMNFFFLAAAFFSFHLLFAYTVDRLPIGTAFALCSIVSMFLTVTYLRVVVGWRFASVEAGLAQVFYLILFSLALFNEGSSGLAITVGAILTLFVTMQLTARIDWAKRSSSGQAPTPAPAVGTLST